jgi:hypothetical protein
VLMPSQMREDVLRRLNAHMSQVGKR